jgi:hypothetical protein
MQRRAPVFGPLAALTCTGLVLLLAAPRAVAQEAEAAPADPAEKITVSVARMPLPAGKKLTWDDLTTVDLPQGLVPPTAVRKGTELVGRVLAHPVAQQSPIVGQRLQGWVAPPQPEPEVASTVQIDWDLGPMGALVQAGDVVVWVQTGPTGCRLAQGEVLSRGATTTFEVASAEAAALKAATDPQLVLRGPGSSTAVLASCAPAAPQLDVETP